MDKRRFTLGILVLLACSRSKEDAGIVLNVDADVTTDRTAINRLVVTVDEKRQEWMLTRPLPGSLGITTSPGRKYVTVEGFANEAMRGRWTGTVTASQGSVIVQDVHLAYLASSGIDGGQVDGMSDGPAAVSTPDGGSAGLTVEAGTGGDLGKDGADVAGSSDLVRRAEDASDATPPSNDGALTAGLTGGFALSSQFDISATAAAPGPVRDALDLVYAFVSDPGAAILDYADQAGVPAASALRAALPDALESRLTGWMNAYIKDARANGVSPYDRLVWLDNTVRSLLLYWGLESRLGLPVGGTGTHSPERLIFSSPSGVPLSYPVDPTLLVPATGVVSFLSWPGGVDSSAVVTISDHAFALPFGRYALPALDAILLYQYGTPDVAAYLSQAVDCAGLAAQVASQCLSIACVGHTSDLNDVCEGGLAEGARQIDEQILGIDFKAIRLQQGTATAIGAQVARPQNTTALQDGVWTVTVDFGSGAQPANATFSGAAEAIAP